jgi:hypothetical protein
MWWIYGAVIIVLIILIFAFMRMRQAPAPTLYNRLGGIFAIAAVVNDFGDALVLDPQAGRSTQNIHLADWYANHLDRLPGLNAHIMVMCSIWRAI